MKPIPALSLTLAQQGGIGYPPILVKLDRWYAVSDSRNRKPPENLNLQWQRMYPKKDHRWHPQGWCWRKWYHEAPKLTWDEVISYAINGEK